MKRQVKRKMMRLARERNMCTCRACERKRSCGCGSGSDHARKGDCAMRACAKMMRCARAHREEWRLHGFVMRERLAPAP